MKKRSQSRFGFLSLILVGLITVIGGLALLVIFDRIGLKITLFSSSNGDNPKISLSQPLSIPIQKDNAPLSNNYGSFPIAVSDDGHYLSYVGREKLHLVKLNSTTLDDKTGPTDTGENSMQFLPGSHSVLAGGYSWVLLNAENAEVIGQHKEPPPASNDHTFNEGIVSPDGKLALDERAQLWNLTTAKLIRQFSGQPNIIYAPLQFNKNGSQAYTLAEPSSNPRSENVKLVLWDVASGRPLSDWTVPQSAKIGVLLSPDTTQLALIDYNNQKIILWDAVKHRKLKEFAARSYGQYAAGITLDNHFLVICDQAGVDIWDLKAGKLARKLQDVRPDGLNIGFSLSPNTKYMAVSGSSEIYIYSLAELYS